MERRTLLSVAGGAVATALAGCLGTGGSDDGGRTDRTGSRNDDADSIFEGSFRAESTGGFVAFGVETDSRDRALEEGFEFPADDPIVLEGDVDGGSWESTAVEFPDIRTGAGTTATVETPAGFGGELTPERMTATGPIRITVEFFGDASSFEFDVAATTDRSNALDGRADFESAPATATLVDNAFVVDEATGRDLVDNRLGLPATEAGTNWFELDLEFDGPGE